MKTKLGDTYLSIPLPGGQKDELSSLARVYGLKVPVFARILLNAGQAAFRRDPGECFRSYAASVAALQAEAALVQVKKRGPKPKTKPGQVAPGSQTGDLKDVTLDPLPVTALQQFPSFKPAEDSKPERDPGCSKGTIYDIVCPWCDYVIDTLCERTLRVGDVIDCDHCEKPVEILALGDAGKATIGRYDASK